MPTPEPLWLECYFFELPFDSGVPDNFVQHVKDDVAAAVERGWEGFSLGDFLGIFPEPPTGHMASTTLAFRRAAIPMEPPLAAIEAAFPAVLRDSRRGHSWPRRLWYASPFHRLVMRLRVPPPQPRSIVAATRIAPPPASQDEEPAWRGAQMTTALRVLNEYLDALAGFRTNPAVGPIAAPDLPPLLFGYRRRLTDPVALGGSPAEHFALVLHQYWPFATDPLTHDQAAHAGAVSGYRDAMFFESMTYLREAERALMREDPRRAIIDASTAIELGVSDVMRRCGPLAGYNQHKLDNVIDGAFASRVKDHFARLLSFASEPLSSTDELGGWWRNGYLIRNQIVHRGYIPSTAEAGTAVQSANELLDESIDRIHNDDRFSGVLNWFGQSTLEGTPP
jgi:hypothetical protein